MQLTDLPNIGPALAGNLQKVGIDSAKQLRNAGTYDVFMRIRTSVDAGACLHQLEALEGVVEGVKKSALSPEKKGELRSFFKNIK